MAGEGDLISQAVGIGLGTIGSIGKLFGRARANKDLEKLYKQEPVYSANPLAQQRLSLAQTVLNAKMPGSASIERGIYAGYGNQAGNISRNASSGAQALALGAANVGQMNDQFMKEGQQQGDYYKWATGNLQNAQQGVINEGHEVFNDQTRRFEDKVQMQGAINANRQGAWTDLQNFGGGISQYGMNGGFSQYGNGRNPNGGGGAGTGGYIQ